MISRQPALVNVLFIFLFQHDDQLVPASCLCSHAPDCIFLFSTYSLVRCCILPPYFHDSTTIRVLVSITYRLPAPQSNHTHLATLLLLLIQTELRDPIFTESPNLAVLYSTRRLSGKREHLGALCCKKRVLRAFQFVLDVSFYYARNFFTSFPQLFNKFFLPNIL